MRRSRKRTAGGCADRRTVNRPRSDFTGNLTQRVKCKRCGEKHSERWRRPGWCLPCDLIDRGRQGESVEAIATRMQLPPFLIEEFLEG